jgi:hypothetical protein
MEPVTSGLVKGLTKEAGEALKKESEGFLKAVYGEPARALGGLFTDKINKRRHANLIKITVEAKRKLAGAGVSPKEVPLKIIHPMLEAASLEEDPDMQTRWANLLAKAADQRAEALPPSFPRILAEMSSREARFLDGVYDQLSQSSIKTKLAFTKPLHRSGLFDAYMNVGLLSAEAFSVDIDSLLRFRLIGAEAPPLDRDDFLRGEPVEDNEMYRLTALGLLFVKTCKGI